MEKFRYILNEFMDYWRNQGCNALHYQQEPCENDAQEHQRAAVQFPAAFARSRTVAQMTVRFRSIEKNVEGLSSEITAESAQAFEAERHTLIHEAIQQKWCGETLTIKKWFAN